jgi:hypothetical protein
MDVEGAEVVVLLGAKNYLTVYKPSIMLATHDCHLEGVKDRCLKLLDEYGYSYKKIDDFKKIVGQEDYYCIAK